MSKEQIISRLPEAAIFDVDGVLVDTEYFQWQGWVEVLKPLGKSISKEKYFNYAGKHGDIIETELLNEFNLKRDEHKFNTKRK